MGRADALRLRPLAEDALPVTARRLEHRTADRVPQMALDERLGRTEAGGGMSEYTIRPFASRHWWTWADASGAAASASINSGSRCRNDMTGALRADRVTGAS